MDFSQMERGAIASKVLLVICTVVTGSIFLMELWGFHEFYRSKARFDIYANNIQFRILLFLQNLCVFCLGIAGCVSYFQPFRFSATECNIYSMALSDLYAVATMIFWIFLIKKIQLVSKYERSLVFKLLFFLACVLAFLYWPFVKIPLNAVYYTGFLLPNGICVPGKSSDAMVLRLMIAANIAFMFISTALFIRPLLWSTRLNVEGKPLVMRTVRKTVILSLIGTSLTTVALVNMQIAISVADLQTIYLFIAMSLGYHIVSLTTDSLCAHIMTSVWLPEMIKKRVNAHTSLNAISFSTSQDPSTKKITTRGLLRGGRTSRGATMTKSKQVASAGETQSTSAPGVLAARSGEFGPISASDT